MSITSELNVRCRLNKCRATQSVSLAETQTKGAKDEIRYSQL
jgi:hypothetical protein